MSSGRASRAGRPKRGESPPQTVDVYECSGCGASVQADATECPVCGDKFEGSDSPAEAATPETPGPRSEGHSGRKKVVAAAVALVLVGLLGWGIFQLKGPAPPGGTSTIVQG